MSKKDNIPMGVQQEFDDIDYWHKLSKTKKAVMSDGTVSELTEYEWYKRYMHEAYANNFDRQDNSKNILKTEEQKKWARRNNNNTNRDVLNRLNKTGAFANLMHVSEEEVDKGESTWKTKFKSQNYDAAAMELMRSTCEELELEYNLNVVKSLLRFNYRLKTLLSYIRADQKAQKKKCRVCRKSKLKKEFRRDKRQGDGRETVCRDCRGRKNE